MGWAREFIRRGLSASAAIDSTGPRRDAGDAPPGMSPLDYLRARRATFLALVLGYVGFYLIRQNLPAAFPLMHAALGYSNTQLGLIAAASEIAYAVGKFLNGPLIDRFGGKRLFLIGMAGGIAANLLFALGESLAWFVVLWCVCRYFLAMGWGSVTKTMGAWYPSAHSGRVMGLASLSLHFGGVAAALFAGTLVGLGFGWPALFVVPALVLCVVWLAVRHFAHDRPSGAPAPIVAAAGDGGWRIARDLWRKPVFRQLLWFSLLTTALRSAYLFWVPKFLVDQGMGTATAIFGSAVLPLCGGAGVVWLGWYTDTRSGGQRTGAMGVLLAGLALTLGAIALFAAQSGTPPVALLALLGVAGFCLLGPYSMSAGCLTLDIAGPKAAGTCVGLVDGVGYLGGAVAAWGIGALADRLGWSGVYGVMSGGAVVLLWINARMGRHLALPSPAPVLAAEAAR